MNRITFYLLSFTWGLPLTLVGLIVALVMICTGHKPQKWGYCYYFEVGQGWGGLELGIIFLTNKNPSVHTKNHEHGHAIQNCSWGFLMPFVVSIPSAIRYWYRIIKKRLGYLNLTKYDSVWFESQATKWGTQLIERLKEK
jgi:hypothetical protein